MGDKTCLDVPASPRAAASCPCNEASSVCACAASASRCCEYSWLALISPASCARSAATCNRVLGLGACTCCVLQVTVHAAPS